MSEFHLSIKENKKLIKHYVDLGNKSLNRNFELENKFRKYLFKGNFERFKTICKDLNIINNLKVVE